MVEMPAGKLAGSKAKKLADILATYCLGTGRKSGCYVSKGEGRETRNYLVF